MQSFIAKISTGYLVDRAATIVGWSPLGRRIQLQEAEGPQAATFEGLAGNVTSWDDDVIVVECSERHDQRSPEGMTVRLTPRHSGWTGRSLMLLPIAVVATAIGQDGVTQQAIAIARLK